MGRGEIPRQDPRPAPPATPVSPVDSEACSQFLSIEELQEIDELTHDGYEQKRRLLIRKRALGRQVA